LASRRVNLNAIARSDSEGSGNHRSLEGGLLSPPTRSALRNSTLLTGSFTKVVDKVRHHKSSLRLSLVGAGTVRDKFHQAISGVQRRPPKAIRLDRKTVDPMTPIHPYGVPNGRSRIHVGCMISAPIE
jgi:hypothetical protein